MGVKSVWLGGCGHTARRHTPAAAATMAKKNRPKQLDNEDDGGPEEEEPDFSDPEDYVDDITDEGEAWGAGAKGGVRGRAGAPHGPQLGFFYLLFNGLLRLFYQSRAYFRVLCGIQGP